jgi:hypothetical protein
MMAQINAYEFDYAGKHYRWDRSTLRSPEGRAEIQRVLTARVAELDLLGYTAGYDVMQSNVTAKHVLEALALPNGGGEAIFRAIEEDVREQLSAAPQEEIEVATPTNETAKSPNVDVERVREMIRLERADPELRRALLRNSKEGLTSRQAAQFDEYKSLETANNEQAYRERAVKSGMYKGARPHMIPSKFYELERIADPRERTHAIRELRAQMRDDKASPYNNASHPEHRAAVEQMTRLYRAEEELGPQPEDGE